MRIAAIFLMLITISHFALGQVPYFKKYNLPEEKEKTNIHVLFQDRNGFIWMGTDNGLFQFDGFSFSNFTIKDSLPDISVTAIAQDSLGRIWMGHSTGQLSYVDEGKVYQFVPEEGNATKEISDIHFDRRGVLWFSTLNDGLYYFMRNRLYRLDEENGMPDLFIYDIEESPDGKMWIGTDRGIAVCTLDDNRAAVEVINQKQGLPDNIVKKIKFQTSTSIWIGTQDAGVIHYNPIKREFKSITANWAFGTIADLLIKEDQLWISSDQRGIFMIDTQKKDLPKKFTTETSAKALLLDTEGGIWAGGKSELLRTPGVEISFLEKGGSGTNKNIIALTVDHENNIWFSNSDGLFKMKKESNRFVTEKLNGFPLLNSPIISLHTDSVGNIWVGTFGNGAWHLNSKGVVMHYFKNELRNGNILSIDSKGSEVWFATLEGSTRIKMKGNHYETTNIGSKEGLSSDYIYQVFQDRKNRVWFATDGHDIDMIDQKGIHHFPLGKNPKVVYGFTEDGNHDIWANIQGDGLYKFTEGKFTPVKKLKSNAIYSIAANSFGNIVATHDLGIEVFDVTKNTTQFFGEEYGITNMKGNLNSIAKSANGEIFIGTENGIIQYQPSETKGHPNKPTPYIQQLKAAGNVFNSVTNLNFAYDENDITINYFGFWYENPQILNYQFKLENFDRDWINSKNLEVTYSRLPPGEYTFVLRVSNSDNFSGANETKFQFKIQPPFWQQPWFYMLVLVLAISSLYLYIRLRERKLKKERKILKLKVEERTKELQIRNEEIEAQAEELQTQASEIQMINEHLEELVKKRTAELEKKNQALEEYAFINAHKLRAPLASILGVVNIIAKLPQTPESQDCIDHLKKSSDALDEVVTSITRAIQKGDSA